MEGGRIGEGEDRRDTNSESDSRRRSRSPRHKSQSQSSRPKGSELTAPESKKDEETEIDIPESGRIPKTPSLEEYTKGIYFLEITTNTGVVNKKLILQ